MASNFEGVEYGEKLDWLQRQVECAQARAEDAPTAGSSDRIKVEEILDEWTNAAAWLLPRINWARNEMGL